MPATPVEKAFAAHIVSAVAASRAFSNGSRTENAAGENVIGRTHTDKPIYANRLAHQYKDFTAGDHKDAANAHSHLMDKSRQSRDAYESHVDAASFRKSHTGEGSRGGHVIGHTKSGKPIYSADHPMYHPPSYARFLSDNPSEQAPTMHFLATHAPGWSSKDHLDAVEAHRHGDMRLPALLHAQAAEEKRDVERSHPPTDRYSDAVVRGKPKLAMTTSGHDIHLLGEDTHPSMRHSQTGRPLHTLYGITNHGQEDKAPMLVQHAGKTFVRSGYNSDNGTVHYHEHDPGKELIDPGTGFATGATAYDFRKYTGELKPQAGHLYHVQGDPQIAGGTLPHVINDPHHGKLSVRGYNTDSHYTVYHQNDKFPDWPSSGLGKSATTEGAGMAENTLAKALAMQAATTVVLELLKGGASVSPGFNPDAPHPESGGYSKWRAHPGGGVDHVSGHGTYHATPVAGGHSLKFTPHGGGEGQHLGNFPDHQAVDRAQVAHGAKLSAAGAAEAVRRRATNPAPPKISHDPLGKSLPPTQQWKPSPGNTHAVNHFASHGSYTHMPSLGEGGSHSMSYHSYRTGKTRSLGSFDTAEKAHAAASEHHALIMTGGKSKALPEAKKVSLPLAPGAGKSGSASRDSQLANRITRSSG